MALFDNWTKVADSFVIGEGRSVRFLLSFAKLPLTSPDDAELSAYIEKDTYLSVQRIERMDYGLSVTLQVYCTALTSFPVGALRDGILGAIADMNSNRTVPVTLATVGTVEAPDADAPGSVFTLPGPAAIAGLGVGAIAGIAAVIFFAVYLGGRRA